MPRQKTDRLNVYAVSPGAMRSVVSAKTRSEASTLFAAANVATPYQFKLYGERLHGGEDFRSALAHPRTVSTTRTLNA